MDYTSKIETDGNRPIILQRNGGALICPFATRFPLLEGTIEKRLRVEQQPCGEFCPHFNVVSQNDANNTLEISLSCGSKTYLTVHILKSAEELFCSPLIKG
jgi:hypothetical protein